MTTEKTTFFGMYDFYATPDGENCLEKTLYYGKYSALFGFGFSSYDIVLNSKPPLVSGALARYGRFMLPMTGIGLLYGATICMSAQLRKKDDTINHTFAGVVAGAVWGLKFDSMRLGALAMFFVGFYSGYIKYLKHHNLRIMESYPPCEKTDAFAFDASIKLYDDRPRPKYGY